MDIFFQNIDLIVKSATFFASAGAIVLSIKNILDSRTRQKHIDDFLRKREARKRKSL
ncbi:hypothetical protein GCM10011514_41180 [Emticicia aquatilis]|uniref:Uncharacterized protein n=1 Tax=Emticicia aquatilis TaxID=1537369 RepID=A0A916Z2F4_9BACT|nr:hypothetical protein GCM10011514_41180 [Emticicia aquatilis]